MAKNPCTGCIHWRKSDFGRACHYSLDTGKLRGCLFGAECIHRNTGDGELPPIVKPKRVRGRKPRSPLGDGTLCWECLNAVPDARGHGCSWSIDSIPVKGWDAERSDLTGMQIKSRKSYFVHACPLFEKG